MKKKLTSFAVESKNFPRIKGSRMEAPLKPGYVLHGRGGHFLDGRRVQTGDEDAVPPVASIGRPFRSVYGYCYLPCGVVLLAGV